LDLRQVMEEDDAENCIMISSVIIYCLPSVITERESFLNFSVSVI
jgi:hypothetical protein